MKRFLVVAILATLGLAAVPAEGPAQTELAQYYPAPPQQPYYYDKQERERMKEERWQEKQWRKEEKRRQREEYREQQQWYNDQWRWQTQRYFGAPMPPYPGENYEAYAHRVRQQCNYQWNSCANYCNTIRDPNRRAACVATCNNELYQCQSAF